jgi:hypothetical protein
MGITFKQGCLLTEIHSAGCDLFKNRETVPSACCSLLPLGIGLVEGAALFSVFDASIGQEEAVRSLFDGGETRGPNLYTRLKCVRDLFSASSYALREKCLQDAAILSDNNPVAVATPGELQWIALMARHTCARDEECVREVARLLDDSLEAMIAIASNLRGVSTLPPRSGSRNEVYRHVCHVRDHFDYAEDMLLACICPSAIEERNQGSTTETFTGEGTLP